MWTKQDILRLRSEGKTYREIVEILHCSLSIVCYYCGAGQISKKAEIQRQKRKNDVIERKLKGFRSSPRKSKPRTMISPYKDARLIAQKTKDFHRASKRGRKVESSFSKKDILAKFGETTICYLTGKPINLLEPRTYSFDHIFPVSRGGESNLDNLGIACSEVNQAKRNLTVEEFISLCRTVLEHNGFLVTKRS